MINLVTTVFTLTGITPDNMVIKSTAQFDENGVPVDKDSFEYRILEYDNGKQYLTEVQDPNLTYLQSGGDFIRGLLFFVEVIASGMALVFPTLTNLGVPGNITFLIVVPIYLLYLAAIIQLVSGRTLEGQF
jgi:hypothetical protein